MKKIGIFHNSITGNSRSVAELIAKSFGESAEVTDITTTPVVNIDDYNLIIFGTSTWKIGELDDWKLFLSRLGRLDASETKFALFALGDQEEYPDQFVDNMGDLYDILQQNGAVIIGATNTAGYRYTQSNAVERNRFVGLALDEDTQPAETATRIKKWVGEIRKSIT